MKSKKLFQKQKRHSYTSLFIILLLTPYIFGFVDYDSAYTQSMIGVGTGQYVYHDCEGAHKRYFADAGIYFGKKYSVPFRLGFSGGFRTEGTYGSGIIIFPDIALDLRYFSIGTTGIRLGSENDLYLESKWLDQPPFLSGKGLTRLGIGGKLDKPFSRFWIGTNVVPYNDLGLATQLEFPWEENKYLYINGRYGKDRASNFSEYGFSVGMKMISF